MTTDTITDKVRQRTEHELHKVTPMRSLDMVFKPIKRELDEVRNRVLSELTEPIAKTACYLIFGGGKQVRPALVLLTGMSGSSPRLKLLIEAASAVELIHTATLIHDDIIDEAPLRRKQPTFHSRWGIERAVLMGDYLYAAAFTVLGKLGMTYVTKVMADVCRDLSRGELLEVETRYRLDLHEDEYLDIIRNKTASLFAGCCRSGAYIGGTDNDTIDRFTVFGMNLGMAFQIMDDCLDFMGNTRELGKLIHTDLDKGTVSLPIIYLNQQLSVRERNTLFAPLRKKGKEKNSPLFLDRVAKAVQSSGAIKQAQRKAITFVEEAQASVSKISCNGLGKTYEHLAAYAVARRS